VIAPVGASSAGESLNINADTAAGRIAGALAAEKLFLLTDVEGIRDAGGTLIPSLDANRAVELIENGVVTAGMIPKVECCLEALRAGVQKVHVIDGRVPHAVLLEMFTDHGIGTEVHDAEAQPSAAPARERS
jgi:acetylglutamate kinase